MLRAVAEGQIRHLATAAGAYLAANHHEVIGATAIGAIMLLSAVDKFRRSQGDHHERTRPTRPRRSRFGSERQYG